MAVDLHDDGRRTPSSPQQHVEALSTGRARRAMAGSRMRELIEQERERILAEGGDEDDDDEDVDDDDEGEVLHETGTAKAKSKGKRRRSANEKGKEVDDEDAIFRNEDNDIDFEARDDADDIVDSDFDLSSDQGSDDEEEGERALQAEEKAAKKASRAKAVPAHMRRAVAPIGSSVIAAAKADKPARQAKRISFADNTEDGVIGGGQHQKRSSNRKATMEVTQSVQARAKADEERRARQSEAKQPKRKRVRISQADYIAEALEMEEQNRESLKRFLEREEERRERDRKSSKRTIDGPFLRWRSVIVDRNGTQRKRVVDLGETGDSAAAVESKTLTLDPVFAAREAARKEKQAHQQSTSETTQLVESEDSVHVNPGSTKASDSTVPSIAIESAQRADGSVDVVGDTPTRSSIPVPMDFSSSSDVIVTNGEADPNTQSPQLLKQSTKEKAEESTSGQDVSKEEEDKVNGKTVSLTKTIEHSVPPQPEWEARAYVSLHEVPTSTPWPKVYSHILGSHVDWSRYTVVAARNRPLRPRQSVCTITGLPAKYRDPRSGIAFANCDAYASLTQVMHGDFRWSGEGTMTGDAVGSDDSGSAAGKASQQRQQKQRVPRYDPLQMGCYLDRIDEPGANNVLLMADTPTATTTTASNSGRSTDRTTVASRMHVEYVPRNALAPGDEQALVAAALALPAGSTRSGSRRSTTK